MKVICWFSCGLTSAVACKLAVEKYGKENCILIYIDIATAHPDNDRFIENCEKWIGADIHRRKSDKYDDQFEVCEKRKFINGASGSPCTLWLKKKVREQVEKEIPFSHQVFGFEFVKKEINRAIRFSQQYPKTKPVYPLIEKGLNKEQCAYLILKNDIKMPEMYRLGFQNNNCICCVKGGMGYFRLVRQYFPVEYDRMAKLERKIGATCVKGRYLDELTDADGRYEQPILPDCGTFCEVEFADLMDINTDKIFNKEISISDINN